MPGFIRAAASGWSFVVEVARRWYYGGIGDLAAGVTFWILVSLPASILAMLATLGSLDSWIGFGFRTEIETTVLEFVDRVFTDEASGIRDAVAGLFQGGANSSLLTVSLVVALWSISRGFAGLIRALNDIYLIENRRPWYNDRIMAVVLGLGSLLVSVPLVLLERWVWDVFPDGVLERTLRGLVAMSILVGWAATVYHYAPASRTKWRYDLPGAITAAVMWWMLSEGFGWYVRISSGSNGVTAAVGAGLLALTWLWLAAQVLLIGGTVNVVYAERRGISRTHRPWGEAQERIRRRTGEIRAVTAAGPSLTAGGPPVPAGAAPTGPGAGRTTPGELAPTGPAPTAPAPGGSWPPTRPDDPGAGDQHPPRQPLPQRGPVD
ncbi:MAG: YhjD/YihY/BrkB family envelope integrity protein [Acidimicrobiales bacterium]